MYWPPGRPESHSLPVLRLAQVQALRALCRPESIFYRPGGRPELTLPAPRPPAGVEAKGRLARFQKQQLPARSWRDGGDKLTVCRRLWDALCY